MRARLFFLHAVLILNAHAIGLQHGLFRSQSTQGPAWVGTAPIVNERYSITVNPDYLDVELDLEFGLGGVKPSAYEKALEIVGNLNLEKNSTVVGMLVWYKGKILKGKLKTKDFARKQYEEVVDRNSPAPPPPRDPVLLEWIRTDNYDISIFPVEWGGTRKIRIRYLVPSNGYKIGYPHAFSSNASVTIKLGPGVNGFDLEFQNGTTEKIMSAITLNKADYEFRAYGYSAHPHFSFIIPNLSDSTTGSKIYTGSFKGNHFDGQMAQIFYQVPEGFLDDSLTGFQSIYKVFASVKTNSDSCKKAIYISEADKKTHESLRLYSKDPLGEQITWSLFKNNDLIKQTVESPKVLIVEDGLHYARSFGVVPFYPLSQSMPASLGISLGFIDSKYTLVALEEDTLGANLESNYINNGVPTLNPEDLFPSKDESYDVAMQLWLTQRQLNRDLLLQPIAIGSHKFKSNLPNGFHLLIKNGRLFIEIDPSKIKIGKDFRLSITDLNGKIIKQWVSPQVMNSLNWSPSESSRAAGTFIFKISNGSRIYSQQFSIN